MDGRDKRIRQRDQRRWWAKTNLRVQRILGVGGKPQRRSRLVAQIMLKPGDELQLVANVTLRTRPLVH